MPEPSALAGDRARFLAVLHGRLSTGVPVNHTHPVAAPGPLPSPRSRVVDADDLLGSFLRTAAEAGAVVERSPAGVPSDDWLRAFVALHGIHRAVVSAEREAIAAGEALARLGVDVTPSTPASAVHSDVGITSAVALVAATGSLAVRADVAGSRSVSLLPRVHLCIAPANRVVAGTNDVFGPLAGHPERLPSNLVLITGPSRTGDIEQILTRGVHGPVAVHILLTD